MAYYKRGQKDETRSKAIDFKKFLSAYAILVGLDSIRLFSRIRLFFRMRYPRRIEPISLFVPWLSLYSLHWLALTGRLAARKRAFGKGEEASGERVEVKCLVIVSLFVSMCFRGCFQMGSEPPSDSCYTYGTD